MSYYKWSWYRIIESKNAFLTLKSSAEGIANHEFEYLIPIDDAESLLELTPHKITKTRYELNIVSGSWIVDRFEGANYPLTIAEVELPTINTNIVPPNWCKEEITGQQEWSNAALAQRPISKWQTS